MVETEGRSVDVAFGMAVAQRRKAIGLSQGEFAQLLTNQGWPIDTPAVSRIEKGRRSVRLPEVFLITEVLGVDVRTLVGDLSDDNRTAFERAFSDYYDALERTAESIKELTQRYRHLAISADQAARGGGGGMPSSPPTVPTTPLRFAREILQDMESLFVELNEMFYRDGHDYVRERFIGELRRDLTDFSRMVIQYGTPADSAE